MSLVILSLMLAPTFGAISAILTGPRSKYVRNALLLLLTSIPLGINSFYLYQATFSNSFVSPTLGPMLMDVPGLLMAEIIFGLGFLVTIYSFAYMRGEVDNDVYYAIFMLFLASMTGMVFTYNVVVLLAFLEASTVMSAVLILYGRSRAAARATTIYLGISIVEALFVLLAIFVLQTQVGTIDILSLKSKNLSSASGLVPTLVLLFTVGFGTKAALIPLGPLWLPPAHGEAPSPVSAMLSGIMIKLGAFAMARTLYALYPWVGYASMALTLGGVGVITMVFGVIFALLTRDIKKLLAWSSVSQMGYVVMGIGLATPLAVLGGLFHLLNHAVLKSLLFLSGGAIHNAVGTRQMDQMGGLFSRMPVTATMFILGGASISGIPPFNGFVSKSLLHAGTEEAGVPVFGVISVAVSVLTLLCFARASYWMFFRRNGERRRETGEPPLTMLVPIITLGALCVIFGVYPDIVLATLIRAAAALTAPMGGAAHV